MEHLSNQNEDNSLILRNDPALLGASMEDSDLAVVANTLDSLFQRAHRGKYPGIEAIKPLDSTKKQKSKDSAGFSDLDELKLETQYSKESKLNLCRDLLKLLKTNLNEELNEEKVQVMLLQSHSLYKQISKMSQDLSNSSIPTEEQDHSPNSPIFAKRSVAEGQQMVSQPTEEETPRTCYDTARYTLSTARSRSNTGQATQRSASIQFENTSRQANQNSFDEGDDNDDFFDYQLQTHRIEEVKDDFVESFDDDPQSGRMTTPREYNGFCQKSKKVPSISTAGGPLNSIKLNLFTVNNRFRSQNKSQGEESYIKGNRSLSSNGNKTEKFSDSNNACDDVLEALEQQDVFESNPPASNRRSLNVPSQGERTNISAGMSGSYSMEIFNNIPTVRSISISTQSKNSPKLSFRKSLTNSNEVSDITNDWSSLQIYCILSSSVKGKTYMVKNNDEIVVLKRFEMERNKENLEYLDQVKRIANLLKELDLNGFVKHHFTLLSKNQASDGSLIEYGIVTEYMAGGDLQGYLKGNEESITFNKRKQLAFKLLTALDEMHNHGLKHGNLKLRNCLLSNDHFELKLSDILINDRFGDQDNEEITLEDLKYIAPELRDDEEEKASYRSDIWSFGMCLVMIIVGPNQLKKKRVPGYFVIETQLEEEIEYAVNSVKTDSKSKLEFRKLIQKCLIWNPENRASCQELLKDGFFDGMEDESN